MFTPRGKVRKRLVPVVYPFESSRLIRRLSRPGASSPNAVSQSLLHPVRPASNPTYACKSLWQNELAAAGRKYLICDRAANIFCFKQRSVGFSNLTLPIFDKRSAGPVGMNHSCKDPRCLVAMFDLLIQC